MRLVLSTLGLLLLGVVLAASGRAAAGPCAPLAAAQAHPFAATTNHVGVVDLRFFEAQGAPVTFYECVGTTARRLGEASLAQGAITSLPGAVAWRCDRLRRRFSATATLPGGLEVRGTTTVRTRSCAQRLALQVPAHAAVGRPAAIRLVDRWALGDLRARLCVEPPPGASEPRRCRTVAFPPGARARSLPLRAHARGRWRVTVTLAGHTTPAAVAVGVRATPPPVRRTVLATGDSTMQGVDSALADDLGASTTVVDDVHPGSSISHQGGWTAIARHQLAEHGSITTSIISLGAAEGWPMRIGDAPHACCDAAWGAEYERRVREAMRVYGRGGRARVLWLTIAAPRDPERQVVVAAVNAAIVRAARGLPRTAVLRMDLLFSPAGYQEHLRDRGRDVAIREPDGVHLNASGTAIEAREVARFLRGQPTLVPAG